jgi:hypothetical protein
MQARAWYSRRVFVKSVVRPTQEGCFETMVAAFCWFAGAHRKCGVIGTDARLCKAVVDPPHLWGPT